MNKVRPNAVVENMLLQSLQNGLAAMNSNARANQVCGAFQEYWERCNMIDMRVRNQHVLYSQLTLQIERDTQTTSVNGNGVVN